MVGGVYASTLRSAALVPSRCLALIANVQVYDVEGAARKLDTDTWSLPRGELVPGDLLVFWRTRGPDGKRGVVAFGQVTHAPTEVEVPADSRPFWRGTAPGPHRGVRFRYLPAPNLPLWLDDDPTEVLSGLSVSRAQGNKPYKVSPEQWDALVQLAGGLRRGSRDAAALGPSWVAGPALRVHDAAGEIDATFHVDTAPDGARSVVLESRGAGRNDAYARGLVLLLERLASLGATIDDAVVDSAPLQATPLVDRRLALGAYPIGLGAVADVEGLARRIGAAMAEVGRPPGAKGGGNRTKRLRLVVSVALRAGLDVRLAGRSTEPVAAEPAAPAYERDTSAPAEPIEALAARVIEHLRRFDTLTETEVTALAGSPRAYRRLRRHLDQTGAPLQFEATPRGTLWRLRPAGDRE